VTSREDLGRLVRQTWVDWAREQPDPKPSWLMPWEDLDDGQREVDMRIGEAVATAAQYDRLGVAEPERAEYTYLLGQDGGDVLELLEGCADRLALDRLANS
jgi:hypothetical protein